MKAARQIFQMKCLTTDRGELAERRDVEDEIFKEAKDHISYAGKRKGSVLHDETEKRYPKTFTDT